jgi:hypothetical protein
MAKVEQPNGYSALTIILGIASLVLLIGAIFILQLFSVAYGAIAGVIYQNSVTNANNTVIPAFAGSASNINSIYNSVLVQYVVILISVVMLVSAVFLYRYRVNLFSSDARGYTTLHGTMIVFYILLFFINLSNSTLPISVFNPLYLYAVYLAMAVCVMIDTYIFLSRYLLPGKAPTNRDLSIDPSRPYSNLLKMRDSIFSRLNGRIGVVDKHMNSIGIENFHRLIRGNYDSIAEINILTSRDMLDSDFSQNYLDCKSEAETNGVRFNILLMAEDDAAAQHERFIFDNRSAFKVPPFNIIHKKSEHITRLKLPEVKKRFDELYRRSIKYENYVSKNGRPK